MPPACLLAALALASADPAPARAALPPQGVYEQCAPDSTIDCGQRLKLLGAAGFDYVLNYTAWSGNPRQIRRYADQAAAAGIKVIWPLNDPVWRDGTSLIDFYDGLGPMCSCSANTAFKWFALGLVKHHPATWGFYIGDEIAPSAQNVAQVQSLSSQAKQIAPGMPTLYVSLSHNLERELKPFVRSADVVGADYYPIGLERGLGRAAAVAEGTRTIASRDQRGTAVVLQSFSWSQYNPQYAPHFPTRAEMQEMRDVTIANGEPELMLWYSLNDLLDSSDPQGNWNNLRAAAFAPHIDVRGPRRRCANTVRFRVGVDVASPMAEARAFLDGRRLQKTKRTSFPVRARGLDKGRHKLRVVATDEHGREGETVTRFRGCGS